MKPLRPLRPRRNKPQVHVPRKAAPKVKTGCLTCKIRRVKCDEKKPSCVRCTKFGIQCDGYPNPSPGDNNPPPRPLYPKSTRFENDSENRYFEIFSSKTAYEILPRFDVDNVRLMLLQASESEPCIRNAVIAIGALDKTFQSALEGGGGGGGGSYFDVQPSEHHRQALRQYSRAIKQMRAAAAADAEGGKMSLRTMLLTCLVILAFEAWNGSQQLAVQQIQTAISLIQEWRVSTRTKTKSLLEFKEPSGGGAVGIDNLIQIFSQLAIQVVFFAERRSSSTGEILESESVAMPEIFETYREAFLYHRSVTRRSTGFVSRTVPESRVEYPGWLPSEEERARDRRFAAERENLIASALHWFKAFEPVSKLWTGSDTELWIPPRMLRVQMLVVYVSLCVMSTSEETAYDAYTDVFSNIADLSAEVVAGKSQRRWAKRTNFSFDSGIIIPLYLVVMKCRDRVVRRRIINMLMSSEWREGLWDSVFAGRLGQWAMEVEEEFLAGDYVPGWARISGVTWKSDVQRRMAVLTCRQRRSEYNEDMRTRTTSITW